MSIIIYEQSQWHSQQSVLANQIQVRYNELKTQLKNNTNSTNAFNKVKSQLTSLNLKYSQLTEQQLLSAIASAADTTLSNALQQAVGDMQQLLKTEKYTPDQNSINKAIQSLSTLDGLFQAAHSQKGITLDIKDFDALFSQIKGLVNDPEFKGFVEIGNKIGYIGAAVGQLQTQKVLLEIDEILGIDTPTVRVKDVGAKKKNGTNITVTTDSIIIPGLSVNTRNNIVSASLNISSKLNVKYTANSQSTKKSVKMASRNVTTFLDEIQSSTWKSKYEQALYNFISFHRNHNDKQYVHYNYALRQNSNWSTIRRAISAELLYNMLNSNNYTFSTNGQTYKDQVTIYNYGDKLFLEDKLVSSAMMNNKEMAMAAFPNVSDIQRRLLNHSGARQGVAKDGYLTVHGGQVKVQDESQAEKIIAKASIIYNQKINF